MVAEAGGDVNLMMAQMTHGTNLANATQSDIATTLDFLGSQMKTFNIQADRTQSVVDSFSYVTTLANLELQQLGDAYVNVGGSAAQAGMSIDDVNALMVTFSNAGLKGGAAGTSLNAVIRNLSTPTDKAAAALKALNVALYDEAGVSRNMFDIMADLEGSLGELSDEERNYYQNVIFDTVAQKGWNMITADGISTISELSDELSNTSDAFDGLGQAAGMAGQQSDNLNGNMAKAKAALYDTAITVGNMLIPAVTKIAEKVAEFIPKITEWVTENKGTIATVAKVAAGLWAAKTAFLAVKTAVLAVKGVVLGIKAAMAGYQLVQAATTAGTSIWGAVSAAAATGTWAFAGSLLAVALPVLAIVAAIAAVIAIVVLLVKHWDKVKEVAAKVWEKIKETFGKIGAFFAEVWEKIKAPFVAAWNWFNDKVIQPIINIFRPIVEKIGEIFSTIWQIIVAVFSFAAQWFNDNVIQPIIGFFAPIVSAIGGFFKAAWDKVTGIFSAIGGWFHDRFTEAWEAVKSVFAPVGDFFKGIWENIKGFFSKIGTAIGDTVSGAFKAVVNAILTLAENKINFFIKGINTVVGIVNKLPGVSIKTIDLLEIPKLAKGSKHTPDTFIAGERGAELITNAPGRAVFTASATNGIFERMQNTFAAAKALVTGAGANIAQRISGNAGTVAPPSLTVSGGGGGNIDFRAEYHITVNGDEPKNLKEQLREHDQELLTELERRLEKKRRDNERLQYA
jgi:TP901 family phage tail tape measure protein